MDSLKARLEALEQRSAAVERRVRGWRGAALAAVVAALVMVPLQPSTAQGGSPTNQRLAALEAEVATLKSHTAALQSKLEKVSIQQVEGRYSIVIDGANLHLRNGLGATNGNPNDPYTVDPAQTSTNGLGNLIVGYNEVQFSSIDRSGSHNLVVGHQNNFASFGGLVAGRRNGVSGPYVSVSGGLNNRATGNFSSVSGGAGNTANGLGASISGGINNIASGVLASISGGVFNTVSGTQASISGGHSNVASGMSSSVSGGFKRQAPGDFDWVAGGQFQDQ